MRIGTFAFMVLSLLFLLSALNAAWLGRLMATSRRSMFYIVYSMLTLLAAAAFAGIRFASEYEWIAKIAWTFYFGSFWIMLQILLLAALPFSGAAGLLQTWLSRKKGPSVAGNSGPTVSRRSFIKQAAILPPAAMTGINTVGLLDAELGIVVRRMDMVYPGLPPHLDGLKIAHMTDVHVGPYVSATDLAKMLDLLQREKPDLLTITGDFVDDLTMLPAVQQALLPYRQAFPLGTWFCMGNHEYIRGAAPIRRMLAESGVNMLDNRNVCLPFRGGTFYVAGVDYPMGARMRTIPADVENYLTVASRGMAPDAFSVLLSHHPDFIPAAFQRKIRLTLAGHTHGAQVGWGSRSAMEFMYPYMRGVYKEQDCMGFVSSGAGHWLPFRLNCPPEVSLLVLRATKLA